MSNVPSHDRIIGAMKTGDVLSWTNGHQADKPDKVSSNLACSNWDFFGQIIIWQRISASDFLTMVRLHAINFSSFQRILLLGNLMPLNHSILMSFFDICAGFWIGSLIFLSELIDSSKAWCHIRLTCFIGNNMCAKIAQHWEHTE